jgi:hypothetical protein
MCLEEVDLRFEQRYGVRTVGRADDGVARTAVGLKHRKWWQHVFRNFGVCTRLWRHGILERLENVHVVAENRLCPFLCEQPHGDPVRAGTSSFVATKNTRSCSKLVVFV